MLVNSFNETDNSNYSYLSIILGWFWYRKWELSWKLYLNCWRSQKWRRKKEKEQNPSISCRERKNLMSLSCRLLGFTNLWSDSDAVLKLTKSCRELPFFWGWRVGVGFKTALKKRTLLYIDSKAFCQRKKKTLLTTGSKHFNSYKNDWWILESCKHQKVLCDWRYQIVY